MVYTLPFMALMPLYGSLGDGLGKRRLLMLGALIFLTGTLIVFASPSLGWFMVGRAIQGIGTAGFIPLCLAIIAESYAAEERGRMMGTWNSIIPLIGMSVPYFGGLLIDAVSWRAIYPIIFATGVGFAFSHAPQPAPPRQPPTIHTFCAALIGSACFY